MPSSYSSIHKYQTIPMSSSYSSIYKYKAIPMSSSYSSFQSLLYVSYTSIKLFLCQLATSVIIESSLFTVGHAFAEQPFEVRLSLLCYTLNSPSSYISDSNFFSKIGEYQDI